MGADAVRQATEGIRKELTDTSTTQLDADIVRETAGKTDAEKQTIEQDLRTKSADALAKKITEKTSGASLTALKATLQNTLSRELKPTVQAELKKKVTDEETNKMNLEIADKTKDTKNAVANGATADQAGGSGDSPPATTPPVANGATADGTEGGTSAAGDENTLDIAESFSP